MATTLTTDRAYGAHEQLVAPARARPQLWRLLVGLVVILGFTFTLNTTFHILLRGISPTGWDDLATGNSPRAALVLLGGFIFLTIGVFVAAGAVSRRDPLGVIGPIPLALGQFWRVARVLAVLGAIVLALPPYAMGAPLIENLPMGIWLALLPLSLVAVLIQTSAEEILFRGYIQQALAARFSSPLVWMILPSVLFAMGHYLPAQAGDNAILIAIWSGIFGILMADVTARAGTLGPAIAIHLFNNISSLLLFSAPETLNGLSLFIVPFNMSDTGELRIWLAVDFATILIAWLAARIAIRR